MEKGKLETFERVVLLMMWQGSRWNVLELLSLANV